MKPSRISLAVCALLALTARANAVADFRRATSLSLSSSSASLHTTGPFGYDDVTPVQSDADVCMTKTTGSLDVDFDMSSLGLPVVVHFVGTALPNDRIRLVANQTIDQCLSVGGDEAFIKTVRGTITLKLYGSSQPSVDSCGQTHNQTFVVSGGGESDLDNQLVIDADSSCGVVSVAGTVVASEIKLGGRSGEPEPDLPVIISSLSTEQFFICPPAGKDQVISGQLQLVNTAPRAGALFTLTSNDSQTPAWPGTLFIPYGQRTAYFNTFIPKGARGDFTFTAQGPQGAVASTTITVTDDVQCRVIHHIPTPRSICFECLIGLRLRHEKPGGVFGFTDRGESLYTSAPTLEGAAGYSTMDGRLTGWVRVGLSTVEFPDMQFFDMNEAGLAVGVDRRAPTPTPVRVLGGTNVEELDSLTGVGEARFVDDAGNAGGWVADALGLRHAALWTDRALTLFAVPSSAISSEVTSMSDDGTVSVVYRTASGLTRSVLFNLADGGPALAREVDVPRGYSGVEVVGANGSGVAGHLLGPNGAEPFLDFGAGVQLIAPMLDKELEVDRVLGLGPANELLVHGSIDGVSQDMILRGEK